MPLVLIDLGPFLIALGALIVCLLVVAFAKAFFGVTGTLLGKLPVIGGWIDSTAHHIEQRITNVFGGFAAQVEGMVGAMWHAQARLIDKLGEEIAKHGGLLASLAHFIPGVGPLADLYRLVREARSLATRLAHRIEGIGHDVVIRTRVIERGIGNDVLPRIRALDREITHTIEPDLAALRRRARALEDGALGTFRWIKAHPWTLATEAFAGAVAVALARLGLSWIRCPTAKSVFNKRGCNLWNDLDNLLGFAFDLVAITSICTVIPLLEEAFGIVAAPLISTLAAAGAGLCSPGSGPPETLPPPGLQLPANPSLALYLP